MKTSNKHVSQSFGFTIVELLVVIVVIGILAAITIVAYTGVSQRAIVSALQSDLSNASTSIKLFQIDNTNYPNTISTDCNASPTTTTNLCLKKSNGNSYIGYSANNSASPQSFLLIDSNSTTTSSTSVTYKVTNDTVPTQLATTMQPGVTPGAVLELRASKANAGITPGINSPFTTTWTDTSGNGNNGALTNMAGTTASGWAGTGTTGDPYKVVSDGVNDYVSVSSLGTANSGVFSYEAWVSLNDASSGNANFIGEYKNSSVPCVYMSVGSGSPTFGMTDAGWSGTSISSGSIADGLVHHVVGTSDGALMRLYIDGVSVGTPTSITSVSGLNGASLLHGDSSAWKSFSLAVARIYPFALTAAQVAANYAAGPN